MAKSEGTAKDLPTDSAAKTEVGAKDALLDAKAMSQKVDGLIGDADFPIQVIFVHQHRKALVIPSAKYVENRSIIEPKKPVTLTLNTREQVWEVISDIAGIAEAWKNDAIGSLTLKAPNKAKASSEATQ